MANLTLCDICKSIIKKTDTEFLLGISEVTGTSSRLTSKRRKQEMQDYLVKWMEEERSGILVFEICATCKKILYHLFNMKKIERAKILKSLENLYNQEPKKKGWGK